MVRRRRQRSPARPLGNFKEGCSSAAMESLESRCLFNVGPGFAAEYYAAPPRGAFAQIRDDAPAPNLEEIHDNGRPTDFSTVVYGLGPQGTGPLGAGTGGYETAEVFFVAEPVFFANFVVFDFEAPTGAAAERGRPAPAAHSSQPAATLQSSSTADDSPTQGAVKSFTFVSAANTQLAYAADRADDDATAVKSLMNSVINLSQRADQPARSDTIDPGRPVLSWLASRVQPLVSLGVEEDRHPTPLLQLNQSNYVGADMQGKRPTEAPTNLHLDATLMRPIAQIGGAAAIEDAVDSLLDGIRAPFGGRPEAAVAIRSAASFASGVQLHLWQASSAALDAQLPWASMAPLLPQVSSEAVQLGEALDAVLADLDELGEGIVSSFTDGDHIAWWLGAGGVMYYVASRHFHGRAASKAAISQRVRRSVATAPRRLSLSVRPVFD